MKNFGNLIWGILFILVGLIVGLNAFGVTRINIFFDGWWTLFIIVPCFIGLFKEREKTGNIIGLLIGIALLLCCQDILDFDMIWKLALPTVLIIIGISFIFKDTFNSKISKEINKLNEKYEKEIKDEEIEIVHNPKVKLSSLIKRYILPFGISTIAVVIYQMIRFKKLGATKTLLTTIIALMLIGLTYASLIAITRIPINKLIIPIGMAIYVITIIVLNMKYEKKLEENK